MYSMVETMLKRVSCRTYLSESVEYEKKQEIREILQKHTRGVFGNEVYFKLVDYSDLNEEIIRSLSTYGVIKGASLYVLGKVKNRIRALEDFGYCMERVILEMTNMGLGTCWLGTSFKRKAFERLIEIEDDDVIPAVSPVGYTAEKRSFTESMVRVLAGSDLRKPWARLFFLGDFDTPLEREGCGLYQVPLEMVRIAPSASNRQPWRVLKEADRDHFHFYMRKSKAYEPLAQTLPFENVDVGIALRHFELAAREVGLKGKWKQRKSQTDTEEREYVISWI